jgi:S1-C subfamily serine protease/TPR repeat protein
MCKSKTPLAVFIAALLTVLLAQTCQAQGWAAFLGGAADAAKKYSEEKEQQQRQRELIELQYRQQKELLEYQYRLEREQRQRDIAEQQRQRETQRLKDLEEQKRIAEQMQREKQTAEAKKQAEEAEQRRNAVSTGTGFFVAAEGYLVTNHHVIEDKTNFAVRDFRGNFYRATVVAGDASKDLALLRIEANYPALRILGSNAVAKGQRVVAVGYPQTSIQGNESKVTDGLISSFSGMKDDPDWFQISVPIQGGNSGGPLATEQGDVVGVVVATANVAKFYKMTGNFPQNVNYAIKSNVLLDFLKANQVPKLASAKAKAGVEAVDASTVMVIAKRGEIEVNYSVSPEQLAKEKRSKAIEEAELSKQRLLAELTEKRRLAEVEREERRVAKEQKALAERTEREQASARAAQEKEDPRLEKERSDAVLRIQKRNQQIAVQFPEWPDVKQGPVFPEWLEAQPFEIREKLESERPAEVMQVLQMFRAEGDAFKRKKEDVQRQVNLRLGESHFEAKRYEEAIGVLQPLADYGLARASRHVASAYIYGLGVTKNHALAVRYASFSKDQLASFEQFQIGEILRKGDGVPVNEVEACAWYGLAANAGNAAAQNNFGNCNLDGVGIEKSQPEAVRWFTLSASNGYQEAGKSLQRIENGQRALKQVGPELSSMALNETHLITSRAIVASEPATPATPAKVSFSSQMKECDKQVVSACIDAAEMVISKQAVADINDDDARKSMALDILEGVASTGNAAALAKQFDIYESAKLPSRVAIAAFQKTSAIVEALGKSRDDLAKVRVAYQNLTTLDPLKMVFGSLGGRMVDFCNQIRVIKAKGTLPFPDSAYADKALGTMHCKN